MSYAYLPTDKVINACECYIRRRDNRIERVREEIILAEMGPRWFFKPRTREQAIKKLESDSWNEYHMITISGGYWARMVYDLLSMAKAAQRCGTATVAVSAETADLISKDIV